MRQDARGWCTRMTQRDGMEREVGRGFRMGNTCTPVADSCQCMAKPLQYCKVISLQLKGINKKKIKFTWKNIWRSRQIRKLRLRLIILLPKFVPLASNWINTHRILLRSLTYSFNRYLLTSVCSALCCVLSTQRRWLFAPPMFLSIMRYFLMLFSFSFPHL